ncbi:MAG TPA: NAD(P)/FAD-dependent oxidoreductase, partial [Clostridia bacterium]|nr:NAD(P)/FAD-dependent oxidoreductase [Clostridia bacterium]
DGFFYRQKRLGVIGNGDYALSEVEELSRFTSDITLFTNGLPLVAQKEHKGIPIVTDRIVRILGEDRVAGLETTGGKYELDGMFVAIGTASAVDFAAKLGVMLEGSDVIVDESFMTNIDGLFAAGDAVGGLLQVAKAVSDGAHAARGMIKKIKEMKPH